jgi:hypothetical protein
MPDNLDRRSFIRRTSMGAAAVGAIAVSGVDLFSAAPANAATSAAHPVDAPVLDGADVIAHVVNARTGEIAILAGTREIKYVNREMAQQLMRATR